MKQAIRPNTINIPALQAVETSKKGPTTEEQQYYSMSKTAGWKLFSKLADRVTNELQTLNREAISAGASFEEIGRNTLVINMAQDIIRQLLNKVNDAVDVCESDGK